MARQWLQALAVSAVLVLTNGSEQIPGPSDPKNASNVAEWLAGMRSYRASTLQSINYTGEVYNDPQLQWTRTTYIQPQMHPYDQFFYDVKTHNYTVDRFLDDLNARYGGIDSMLMWPTYTNIGTDDRSQFDLFSAMPGGLDAVRNVVNELHARGVKVLLPYNPWDTGTSRGGADDAHLLDGLIAEINADGFNGDTMGSIPEEFYNVSRALNHSVGLEPEGGGGGSTIAWDTLGWGYWQYPQVVQVDRWKWLDPRRLTNICERWSKDHTNALQYALFNGDGFESWENVWGTWNGITKRDGEATRRVGKILRFLGGRGYLQSQDWIPHSATLAPGILFASQWPMTESTAWTIVNRGNPVANYSGSAINVDTTELISKASAPLHYYDLYHGIEIEPVNGVLALDVEAGGFGAILATPNTTADSELNAMLNMMSAMTKTALASFSADWHFLEQRKTTIDPTLPKVHVPEGMVSIPGGDYRFEVRGVEIEGSDNSLYNNIYGVDVQHPFDPHPRRYHLQFVNMSPFLLDVLPVSQAEYAAYLAATNALPDDRYHYLKNWDWSSSTSPKPKNGDLPVTYVGLDEARAYCAWAGKRLPGEIEWQYAAQGGDSTRLFPWGATKNQSLYPKQTTGNTYVGPEPLTNYGKDSYSPFGVGAMFGNVWEYTDEFGDIHTRAVILRGGSNYRPSGSMWYLPEVGDLTQHEKYFLMDARYERAGTIGFRCAADIAPPPCTSVLCGTYQAPNAYIDLDSAHHWLAFSNGTEVPNVRGDTTVTLVNGSNAMFYACAVTPVSLSWTTAEGVSASNVSDAICSDSGGFGLIVQGTGSKQTITIVAGTRGLSPMIHASAEGDAYVHSLNATMDDLLDGIWHTVAWTIQFSGSGPINIQISAAPPPPPPPTPPPTPPPPQPVCASQICGELHSGPQDVVSLSGFGSADWAHWGLSSGVTDRKDVKQPLISPLKSGVVSLYSNNPTSFWWSDGTAPNSFVPANRATTTGVYTEVYGAGFSLSVNIPAHTGQTDVRVYCGLFVSKANLTASLSDSSSGKIMGVYSDASLNGRGTVNGMYLLRVPSTSTSLTLTIQWVQVAKSGNINFQAVTVQQQSDSEVVVTEKKMPTGSVFLQAVTVE